MQTKIVACSPEALEEAASALNSGGVVVIPTDTVYGLAAHPAHPEAVARLYTIKNREERKPVAMLAADRESVESAGYPMSGRAGELADRFWPGALTMVLSRGGGECRGGFAATEGFRVPDYEWTRRLLAACGGLLRVTSANMSGAKAATDAAEALASVGLSADLVVDGGPSPGGTASTVVRFERGEPVVLRQGGAVI